MDLMGHLLVFSPASACTGCARGGGSAHHWLLATTPARTIHPARFRELEWSLRDFGFDCRARVAVLVATSRRGPRVRCRRAPSANRGLGGGVRAVGVHVPRRCRSPWAFVRFGSATHVMTEELMVQRLAVFLRQNPPPHAPFWRGASRPLGGVGPADAVPESNTKTGDAVPEAGVKSGDAVPNGDVQSGDAAVKKKKKKKRSLSADAAPATGVSASDGASGPPTKKKKKRSRSAEAAPAAGVSASDGASEPPTMKKKKRRTSSGADVGPAAVVGEGLCGAGQGRADSGAVGAAGAEAEAQATPVPKGPKKKRKGL